MNTKTEVLLVRPAQAATMLGVGRSTIYHLIETGEVPSVRLGNGIVRVPIAALKRIAAGASAESSGGEAA
jgi:excisionase family DNA binding protein